jgi:hypothetical protein
VTGASGEEKSAWALAIEMLQYLRAYCEKHGVELTDELAREKFNVSLKKLKAQRDLADLLGSNDPKEWQRLVQAEAIAKRANRRGDKRDLDAICMDYVRRSKRKQVMPHELWCQEERRRMGQANPNELFEIRPGEYRWGDGCPVEWVEVDKFDSVQVGTKTTLSRTPNKRYYRYLNHLRNWCRKYGHRPSQDVLFYLVGERIKKKPSFDAVINEITTREEPVYESVKCGTHMEARRKPDLRFLSRNTDSEELRRLAADAFGDD